MNIFITGAENIGWALDTDARLAREALQKNYKICRFPLLANVIHSVSPNTTYKKYGYDKKKFVSVFQGEPKRLFASDKDFLVYCRKNYCVAQTKQAYRQLLEFGCENVNYVPYIADEKNFYCISEKDRLREKYALKGDKYIICNFMRDSLGMDLMKHKLEKGADIFLEIIIRVAEIIGRENILILLAGPRRHWIRKKLQENNIPYCYYGEIVEKDDIKINIQSAAVINELMNSSDLLIVSSRTEGGPRSILEASLSKTPIISTDVGLARDILVERNVYSSVDEAVKLVVDDFFNRRLGEYVERNYEVVSKNHSVNEISKLWKSYYDSVLV